MALPLLEEPGFLRYGRCRVTSEMADQWWADDARETLCLLRGRYCDSDEHEDDSRHGELGRRVKALSTTVRPWMTSVNQAWPQPLFAASVSPTQMEFLARQAEAPAVQSARSDQRVPGVFGRAVKCRSSARRTRWTRSLGVQPEEGCIGPVRIASRGLRFSGCQETAVDQCGQYSLAGFQAALPHPMAIFTSTVGTAFCQGKQCGGIQGDR